jgi:hypothetical protein
MKSFKVPAPQTPPNLKAYQDKFGHRQSPESSRAFSLQQLDAIAKQALEANEPISEWRDRSKMELGNVNDAMYKNIRTLKD